MRRFLRVKKSQKAWSVTVQLIRIREISGFTKVQDDFNDWNGFNYFIPFVNKIEFEILLRNSFDEKFKGIFRGYFIGT